MCKGDKEAKLMLRVSRSLLEPQELPRVLSKLKIIDWSLVGGRGNSLEVSPGLALAAISSLV